MFECFLIICMFIVNLKGFKALCTLIKAIFADPENTRTISELLHTLSMVQCYSIENKA